MVAPVSDAEFVQTYFDRVREVETDSELSRSEKRTVLERMRERLHRLNRAGFTYSPW